MSTYELTPEQKIRQRYAWFQEAQRLGNEKLACLRLHNTLQNLPVSPNTTQYAPSRSGKNVTFPFLSPSYG